MSKIAIFVEGQTELIFVREYLLKIFDFQISIDCYSQFTESKFYPTEYAYAAYEPLHYFEIINTGNDNAVLSRILHRENLLWNAGFNKIIGLRDMYSRAYREESTGRDIDASINALFVAGARETIQKKATRPDDIHFLFAIMEVEAWILALDSCFQHVHELLNSNYIAEKIGIDLSVIDPEATFFHPANIIEEIYSLVGLQYKKSKGDIYAIMNGIQKEDFEFLYESDKCASFNSFSDALPLV
jgi:hypothetical protein